MVEAALRAFSLCAGVAVGALFALPADAGHSDTMGLAEGRPAAAVCPDHTYLAGLSVWHDNSFSGLSPYCAPMASDGTWAGGGQVHLDAAMSAVAASPTGSRLDMFCPTDSYVFGFRGYTHVYGIHAVMQLTLTCKNARSGVMSAFGTQLPAGVAVTEWRGGQCADDAVADGVVGFVNPSEIIQFGLSCARTRPAMLVVRPGMRAGALAGGLAAPVKTSPPRNVATYRTLARARVARRTGPAPAAATAASAAQPQSVDFSASGNVVQVSWEMPAEFTPADGTSFRIYEQQSSDRQTLAEIPWSDPAQRQFAAAVTRASSVASMMQVCVVAGGVESCSPPATVASDAAGQGAGDRGYDWSQSGGPDGAPPAQPAESAPAQLPAAANLPPPAPSAFRRGGTY